MSKELSKEERHRIAVLLGRIGGSRKTPAQQAAARRNGLNTKHTGRLTPIPSVCPKCNATKPSKRQAQLCCENRENNS